MLHPILREVHESVTVYSHSRLSSWENCPRKFEYRYIQKIEVTTEGIEAFVGKRVHEILERLYHHVSRYDRPPSLKQVQDRFRRDWSAHFHPDVLIVKTEFDVDYYVDLGLRCIDNYFRRFYPFNDGETVSLEARIGLQLDEAGRYKAQGIVDRIARTEPGCYEIHDYKTGAYIPSQKKLDVDRQLALYQIGLEQSYPDVEEVKLVWHYLAKNRTVRSTRSQDQLAALKSDTISLIDEIEAADSYPPTPSALCRWCEYGPICPEGPRAAAEPDRFGDVPTIGDLDAPAPVAAVAESSPDEEGVQLSLI